jgi:hypothetical protein
MSLLADVAENFSARQTRVSKTSARSATKLLQLRPYKTAVVHALIEHHLVARINACNWFLQSVHDEEVDPQLLLRGGRFSLRGEVNIQNMRYRSAGNPGVIHELPLHEEEIGVWCAMSACHEISSISRQELHRE